MDSIKVCIRARPFITREKEQGLTSRWSISENCLRQKENTHQSFVFDRVFDEETITDEVFCDIASPIVDGAMNGFNGTIFAYGQTASGKTHTMMGNEKEPGVIPQAVHDIYSCIEKCLDREFLLRVSYLEIYNENVHDLLGDRAKNLDIRGTQKGDIYVEHLSEEIVNEPKRIWAAMKKGEGNRHFGVTDMNERSSRSHTIFKVIIESRDRRESDGAVQVAHLNFVDLAGSEKAKQTGASGQRLMEGGHINKSLFTLGQVISQLSDNSSFVNYRDSKLTRILQSSLGGNSRTAIICNVTLVSLDETVSTLRFASSAKRIKNKPILNEILDDEALLKRYKREIDQLKKRVDELNRQSGHQELKEKLAEKERLEAEQQEKIKQLTKLMWNVKPSADLKQRKRRRETWCPGKGGQGAAIGRGGQMAALDLPPLGHHPHFHGQLTAKKSRLSTQSLGIPSFDDLEEEETEENEQSFVVYQHEELIDDTSEPMEQQDKKCEIRSQTPSDEDSITQLSAELEEKNQILRDVEALLAAKDSEIECLGKAVEEGIHHSDNELRLRAEVEDLHTQIRVLSELKDPAVSTQAELKHNQVDNTNTPFGNVNMEAAFKMSAEMIEEIAHLKTQKRQLENEKQQLENDLSAVQLAHHELEEEVKKKDCELNELEEFTRIEADMKNTSLMEKRHQLVEMESKMSDTRDRDGRVEDLEKEIAVLLSEKQLLEEKLNEVENVVENSVANESLMSQLECAEREKTEAETKVAQLESQLCSLSTVSVDSNDLKLIELENQLTALQKEKDEADVRMAEMEESIQQPHMADPSLQVIELENRLDAMTRENQELQTRVTEFEETTPPSENETKIVELETMLAAIQQEKEDLELKVTDSGDSLVADLNDRILSLETERDEALSKVSDLSNEAEEKVSGLQQQLEHMEKDRNTSEAKLIALNNCIEELEQELESSHETVVQLQSQVESRPDSATDLTKQVASLQGDLKAQQLKNDNLHEHYERLKSDQSKTQGKLISEENRDLDQQHRLEHLEKSRRSDLDNFSRRNQENMQIIANLETQVYELNCRLQKAGGEAELATHKAQKVTAENEELKKDIATLEDVRLKHENVGRNQTMDPDKMMDRIKKLNMSLDLTNQRCQKYETKLKEMEAAARKGEDATFERNSLQVQLREVQHSLGQKHTEVAQLHQRYSSSYSDMAQMKLQCDNLKEDLRKVKAENERLVSAVESMSVEKDFLTSNKSGNVEEINKLANENAYLQKEIKQVKESFESLKEELEYYKNLPPPANVEELEKAHKGEMERELARLQSAEHARYEEKIVTLLAEEKDRNAEELHNQIMDIRNEAMEKVEEVKHQLAHDQDQTVNAFQAKHHEEISELESEHANVLQSLEVKHKETVAQLTAEHKSQIDRLLSSNEDDAVSQVMSLTEEVEKLQGELCDAEAVLVNKDAEIEKLETKRNSEIEEVHDAINVIETDLIEKHNLDIENLKKQHREEIYAITERYHSDSSHELDEMTQKHREEVEKLNHSVQTLEQNKTEMMAKLDSVSTQLRETEEEQSELLSKIQMYEEKLASINSELQESRSAAEQGSVINPHQEELLSDLSQHKDNVRELTEQLTSERETTQAKADKVASLEAKIEMGKQMLRSKVEEIDDLVEQYTLEKETVEQLREDHEHESREDKEKVLLLEEKMGKYMNQVLELESVIDNLKSRANTSDTLDSMIITLEELLAKKETRVNELEADLQGREIKHSEELITLELEMQEKLSEALAESEELSSIKSQLQAADNEIRVLKEAKQMLEEEVEQMKGCFKEYNEELSAQQSRLEEADLIKQSQSENQLKCDTLEKEIQSLTAEVEKMQADGDAGSSELKQQLADKEDEVQSLSAELEGAKRTFAETEAWLKNCCDTADEELDSKNTELESHEAEINRLTEQLAKANVLAEKAVSDSSQETLYSQISELQSQIIQMKSDHAEEQAALCKTYDSSNGQVTALTQDVDDKQKMISSLSAELDKLNEEFREVEASYKERCSELMKHCDDADEELEQAQNDNEYLKKRGTAHEKEIESLETALANAAKAAESSEVGLLKQELKDQEKKLVESDLKVVVLERDLMIRMDPLKKEIHSLNRETKYLKEKLQECKQELRKAKNAANESVLGSSKTQAKKVSQVDAEVAALDKEVKLRCLQDDVESLKKKLAREQANNEKLKQHQLALEEKLAKYKSHFGKEIGVEDREALRDMVQHSPAPPELDETVNLNVWGSRHKKTNDEKPTNCEQQ